MEIAPPERLPRQQYGGFGVFGIQSLNSGSNRLGIIEAIAGD
jgi:hypothetical protein